MKATASFATSFACMFPQKALRSIIRTALAVLTLLAVQLLTPSGWAQKASESDDFGANIAVSHSRHIQDMKLISPNVGWVLIDQHLFWTTDDGTNWTDITPPLSKRRVDGVFFADSSSGWAVTSILNPTEPGGAAIQIASTTDAGRSWTFTPIDTPGTTEFMNYGGTRSMFFLDSLRGWVILGLQSSSNFSRGVLLSTDDGGHVWTERPSPPAAGSLLFLTPQDGWLAGGPAGGDLWLTRDGGTSWEGKTASIPVSCTDCQIQRSLPTFQSRLNGFLSLNVRSEDHSYTVTYISHDEGKTWHVKESLEREPTAAVSNIGPHIVSAFSLTGNSLTVQIDTDSIETAIPEILSSGRPVLVDFANNQYGWIVWSAKSCADTTSSCSRQQELLSTPDGGRSIAVITPPPVLGTAETEKGISFPIPTPPSPASASSVQSESSSMVNEVRTERDGLLVQPEAQALSLMKKGFEIVCGESPSSMQALWSNSNNPYRNTGIYIGGCDISCVPPTGIDSCGSHVPACTISSDGTKCTYPSSGKVKSVNTHLKQSELSTIMAQGWGIIPAWVGAQAPLPCGSNSFWLIEGSPLSEGAAEADQAIARATSLGLTGIIYYDMEYYSPGYASCSAAVASFLQGWVNELQNHGYKAGVYIHNANKADFSNMSPKPDSVWVADWGSNATTPPTTLSPYWINQYCSDGSTQSNANCSDAVYQSGTWIDPIVGVPVDEDMVNGYVVTSGGSTLSPTISYFDISPKSATIGTQLAATITGIVGSNPLVSVNLMRTSDLTANSGWSVVSSKSVSGSSVNVTLYDTPAVGTYLYGAQIWDTTYPSNSGIGFEPSRIQVKITTVKPTPTMTVSPNPTSITTTQQTAVTVTVNGIVPYVAPTGTVTLSGGTFTSSATSINASGYAIIIIPAGYLPVGNDPLAASYSGDSVYSNATGLGSVTVTAAAQAPTVVTGAIDSVTNSTATLNGTVNPNGSSTTYWFLYGTDPNLAGAQTTLTYTLPAGISAQPVGVNIQGLNSGTTYHYQLQAHNISGPGTGNILGFATSGTAKTTPTMSVVPSPMSITTAQSLNVTVNVNATAGKATPTGLVYLTVNSVPWGQTLVNGSTTYLIPAGTLPVGSNQTLAATYTPDSNSSPTYNNSSGSGTVTVTSPAKATPTVNVMPTPTSITTAQQLSVTVTVSATSGNPTPTGSVSLTATNVSQNSVLTNGGATFIIPAGTLPVGSNQILTATYTPDSNSSSMYNGASGFNPVTVTSPGKATPTVNVTPSSSSITMQQALTVTVTVNGIGGYPTPTGTVALLAAGGSMNMTLINGTASIVIPAGGFSVGPNLLTGSYQGDVNYNAVMGSNSVTVTATQVSCSSYSSTRQITGITHPLRLGLGNGKLIASGLGQAYIVDQASSQITAVPFSSYSSGTGGTISVLNSQAFIPINNLAQGEVAVLNLGSSTVSGYYQIGTVPYASVVAGNQLYIGEAVQWNNGDPAKVYKVDPGSGQIAASINGGHVIYGLVNDPAHNRVYALNYNDSTASAIDLTSNTVTSTIQLGVMPTSGIVSNGTLFVVGDVPSTQHGKIVEVETASNAVGSTISVGRDPWDIVAVNGCAFVPSQSDYAVAVFDLTAKTVVKTISSGIGSLPTGAAADPATGSVYIANQGSDSISVLTPSSTTTPTVTVTPSSFSITTAQPLTVAIAVGGTPTPTGTVTLNGGGYSNSLTLSSGSTQFSIAAGALTTGSVTLTATYAPDSSSSSTYNGATGISAAVTVSIPTKSTPTVTVTPSATNITTAQALTVTVAVSGTPTPTGSVTLSGGGYTSAATTLSSGSATINIPAGSLATGSDIFTASYTPDPNSASTYNAASGASSAVTVTAVTNPAPVISSMSPAFINAGGTGFTLTVNGSGFTAGSAVYWGSSALKTQVASASQLTAQVTTSNIATAGTVSVTVQTPTPGGGTSNTLKFEIDSASSGTTPPTFTTVTATITPGSSASYPVTLPSSATNPSVTCLNLPSGASCSYSSTTGTVTITTTSSTPAGTYQITVVFTETLPGAASALIFLPVFLLPLLRMRRRMMTTATGRITFLVCLGMVLLAGSSIGCGGSGGGGGGSTPPPPQTHQVTSSGAVTLTVQ